MKIKVGQFSNIVTSIIILLVPIICFLIFSNREQPDIFIFALLLAAIYVGMSFSFFTTFLIEDDQVSIRFFNPFKKDRRIKLSQIKHCKLIRNSIRGSSSLIQIYLIDNKIISINTITFKRELKKLAKVFEQKGIKCELHSF